MGTESSAGRSAGELTGSSVVCDHGDAPLEEQEGARIWHNASLSGVDLLQGSYRRHEFARHFHSVPAIGVVDRGAMRTYWQSSNHDLQAGSVLLLNPGEVHAPGPTGENGWSFRMFYFDNSVFQEWSETVAEKMIHFTRPFVQDRILAQALVRLHRELENETSTLETDSALMAVFARMAQGHASGSVPVGRPRSERNAVNRAREYMRACFTQNVSLAELAEVAQVSQFHLVRAFRREVGLPPHSYLIQLRLEAAQRLLRSGVAISEVAARVGFTDQSHLTRHFKRWTGVTPSQYCPRAA